MVWSGSATTPSNCTLRWSSKELHTTRCIFLEKLKCVTHAHTTGRLTCPKAFCHIKYQRDPSLGPFHPPSNQIFPSGAASLPSSTLYREVSITTCKFHMSFHVLTQYAITSCHKHSGGERVALPWISIRCPPTSRKTSANRWNEIITPTWTWCWRVLGTTNAHVPPGSPPPSNHVSSGKVIRCCPPPKNSRGRTGATTKRERAQSLTTWQHLLVVYPST